VGAVLPELWLPVGGCMLCAAVAAVLTLALGEPDAGLSALLLTDGCCVLAAAAAVAAVTATLCAVLGDLFKRMDGGASTGLTKLVVLVTCMVPTVP
jgi:hypothetical protein